MKSIRRQLTFGLLLGFAVLVGIGSAAVYFSTRAVLLAEFDTALQSVATTLMELTRQERAVQFQFPPNFAPASPQAGGIHHFEFWLADGTLLRRSASLGSSDLPRGFSAREKPQFSELTLPDGRPGRAVGVQFTPIRERLKKPGNPPPILQVGLVVARDRNALDHTLRVLLGSLALGGTVMIGFVVVLVWLVIRKGLTPLTAVADHAAAINASSLQLRFPSDKLPAELLPIAGRLNDLLSRLEESFSRERRFSADVAHELRTPIAELRSLAEVALKWPDEPKVAARAFADTLEIARQMEAIATDLLALARCEAGRQPVVPEPIAVAKLIETIWTPLAKCAAEKKLAVTFDIPAALELTTDCTMFRSILANLLDNAVAYTPESGHIRLDAAAPGGVFKLCLRNTAGNLAPDDLPRLFQRFWRADAARSDSHHSGLGLALTAAFCQRLGLVIEAQLCDPAMIAFTIRAANAPSATLRTADERARASDKMVEEECRPSTATTA